MLQAIKMTLIYESLEDTIAITKAATHMTVNHPSAQITYGLFKQFQKPFPYALW